MKKSKKRDITILKGDDYKGDDYNERNAKIFKKCNR